jgi:hypothetical protein
MDKTSKELVQKSLVEALGFPNEAYAIFKDYVSGLEYIRYCRELAEKGLFVELGEYQCHVFLDWQFVNGDQWKSVCDSLHGMGVVSVYSKHDELFPTIMEASTMKEKGVKSPSKRASSRKKGVRNKPKPVVLAKKDQKGKKAKNQNK